MQEIAARLASVLPDYQVAVDADGTDARIMSVDVVILCDMVTDDVPERLLDTRDARVAAVTVRRHK